MQYNQSINHPAILSYTLVLTAVLYYSSVSNQTHKTKGKKKSKTNRNDSRILQILHSRRSINIPSQHLLHLVDTLASSDQHASLEGGSFAFSRVGLEHCTLISLDKVTGWIFRAPKLQRERNEGRKGRRDKLTTNNNITPFNEGLNGF